MAIKINLMPQKENKVSNKDLQQPFYSRIILIVFIISVMVFACVYYYNAFILQEKLNVLEKRNANLQENISINATKEEFAILSSTVEKGKNIRLLLSGHFYGSKIYELLEKITVKSIVYNKFSQKIDIDKSISISLSGEAESFNALAKQLIVYKKTKEIEEIKFSGASINKDGKVAFTIDLIFSSNLAIMDSK